MSKQGFSTKHIEYIEKDFLGYALHKCNSIKSFSRRHVSTIMRNLIDYNPEETKNVDGGIENAG